jgi:hypothetical protein
MNTLVSIYTVSKDFNKSNFSNIIGFSQWLTSQGTQSVIRWDLILDGTGQWYLHGKLSRNRDATQEDWWNWFLLFYGVKQRDFSNLPPQVHWAPSDGSLWISCFSPSPIVLSFSEHLHLSLRLCLKSEAQINSGLTCSLWPGGSTGPQWQEPTWCCISGEVHYLTWVFEKSLCAVLNL